MYKPYNGIYDDKEYCIKEILSARKVFSSASTTPEIWEGMIKELALVVLYCPEEIKLMAQATLIEASKREEYFRVKWLSEVK